LFHKITLTDTISAASKKETNELGGKEGSKEELKKET
jgi:hypothetical protein